jgi:acyl-CoA thioester hydrolase
MIQHQTQVRVRYGDTDKMAYVYYGKYAEYCEVGRTELIRSLGISYKEMEDDGVMLPVGEYNIRYHRPAKYDDLLTITTILPEKPTAKFITEYLIHNQLGEHLATAKVILVFVQIATNKVVRAPEYVMGAVEKLWQTS